MKSNEVIKFIFAKINDNVKYYSNMKQGEICQIVSSQAMFRKKKYMYEIVNKLGQSVQR